MTQDIKTRYVPIEDVDLGELPKLRWYWARVHSGMDWPVKHTKEGGWMLHKHYFSKDEARRQFAAISGPIDPPKMENENEKNQ